MDMPPPVETTPGALSGPPLLPVGAQIENRGPNSSSVSPIQPVPVNSPDLGFVDNSLDPQPCNSISYPTNLPRAPSWFGRTSPAIAEPPTPRGRPAHVSTLERPMSPWTMGAGTNRDWDPYEWERYYEDIDNGEKGRSAPKPHKKKRRKRCASCTVRPEAPWPAYARTWSPVFDRLSSPSPMPAPLPYIHPPPVSVAPNCMDDPEKFFFDDHQAYVANDPFVPSMTQSLINIAPTSEPTTIMQSQALLSAHTKAPILPRRVHGAPHVPIPRYIVAFLFDTIPRQIYLYSLFTLPSFYFSRVASIFEGAGLTMTDIESVSINAANEGIGGHGIDSWGYYLHPIDSPPVARLKESWKRFTDSLTYEWTVLSFVSVFMFPTISITLQIDGALKDPYIRYSAFLALVCSLMSVSYGCLYIIGFNTICGVHNIADWAEEAQKVKTPIWWNLWVLLAMPGVWFSWSIMFYIACVMILLWRTATESEAPAQIFSVGALDAARIVITIVFMLGIVYLSLIIREFRRRGDTRDRIRERVFESAESSMYAWKD